MTRITRPRFKLDSHPPIRGEMRPTLLSVTLFVGTLLPWAAVAVDLTPRLRELEEAGPAARFDQAMTGDPSAPDADAGSGFMVFGAVALALLLLGGSMGYRAIRSRREERRRGLIDKYGDESIVERIVSRTIWHGETAEQLTDSLGKPRDVDEKVMRTKRLETWKYGRDLRNRYRLRVMLDNGAVVAWEQR